MWLTIRSGPDNGRTVQVTGDRFVVGRDGAGLTIRDERISRQHATLAAHPDGRATLTDLGSRNGTFVNGQRITGPTMITGGDQIQFGRTIVLASATEPSRDRTVAAIPASTLAPPPPGPPVFAKPGPGQATMERRVLQRRTKGAMILATAAILGSVLVVVLAATGVIGGSDGGETERSLPDIIKRAEPSVVFVSSLVDGEPTYSGTGWVLDAEQGLIVTNEHVVNGGHTFEVAIGDVYRPATVLGAAPCDDLAVLQVQDTSGLRTMPLGSQGQLRLGDSVVALGYPGNFSLEDELQATSGVVSVVRTQVDVPGVDYPGSSAVLYPNVVQTDAAINPGNSGGPLVNLDGQLVGVNTFSDATLQVQNYAIGVDRVKEISSILRTGASRGWVGFGLAFEEDVGVFVTDAVVGTDADRAGFNGGGAYELTAIDGTPIDNMIDYCSLVGDRGPGDTAAFTVAEEGGGTPQQVELTFE